jgi:hypothetical protein
MKMFSRYLLLIGSALLLSSLPAKARGTYGLNIQVKVDVNLLLDQYKVVFDESKNTIAELVQAYLAHEKEGAFAGSQIDLIDEPTDFRFNLSGMGRVSEDSVYSLNYIGKNWKSSGSLTVERNENCSGSAIPNCRIYHPFLPLSNPFQNSETSFLKVTSAQVIHFNNDPINQLENKVHGTPPILALGPINFQAANYGITQDGGFRTVNKYGNFNVCGPHEPDRDCADAYFDQISIQRTPAQLPHLPGLDGNYEINGYTYTVQATHSVPGPVPLLGIGVAFRYSRKLRQKLRSLK